MIAYVYQQYLLFPQFVRRILSCFMFQHLARGIDVNKRTVATQL